MGHANCNLVISPARNPVSVKAVRGCGLLSHRGRIINGSEPKLNRAVERFIYTLRIATRARSYFRLSSRWESGFKGRRGLHLEVTKLWPSFDRY